MKRKLNFSSTKSTRLRLDGGESVKLIMEEDEPIDEELALQTTSSCMLETTSIDALPPPSSIDPSQLQHKPIIVPCPSPTATSFPFAFPIILDSNLIPGIRDKIFRPENPETVRLMEDEVVSNFPISKESNSCFGVVPWVASQLPAGTPITDHGHARSLSQTVQGEEESGLIDTDEANVSETAGKAFEFGEALQHWHQNCMAPRHNTLGTQTLPSWYQNT